MKMDYSLFIGIYSLFIGIDECTELKYQILSMKYFNFEYSKEEDRNYKLEYDWMDFFSR